VELTKIEIKTAIESLQDEAAWVRDRLEYDDGQAYYEKLDRLAELNTRIKELASKLEDAPNAH
jgi:hypothetical protein